jgi:hypothetical protein
VLQGFLPVADNGQLVGDSELCKSFANQLDVRRIVFDQQDADRAVLSGNSALALWVRLAGSPGRCFLGKLCFNGGEQRLIADRLDECCAGSQQPGRFEELAGKGSRYSNDPDVRQAFSQHLNQFRPFHFRHYQIRDNDVGTSLTGKQERLFTVGGRENLKSGFRENTSKPLPILPVVVNNQTYWTPFAFMRHVHTLHLACLEFPERRNISERNGYIKRLADIVLRLIGCRKCRLARANRCRFLAVAEEVSLQILHFPAGFIAPSRRRR